jgi:alginate O-acetyltransferase complex protein AlgI
LLFFLAVFAVYWAMPWERPRVWLLLSASVAFYMSWNPWLAALVVGTASIDFLIARTMGGCTSERVRKSLLWLSVGTNLTVLGYLKYANFFLDSFVALLNRCGVHVAAPILHVIVPIGISFYTFEAISYTVDVYRRKIRAERNLLNFLVFILFFPHLVAGPIVRASDFLPQIYRPKYLTWTRFAVGGRQIVLGLFKKMVIADRMALLVDPVFANPGHYETAVAWMAAVAYSIQIYCDFSGYTDIAIGTARLLGYRLAINFAMPFASTNVTEFWRRWHISLSSWIRDYVYIPLGGNRGSTVRTSFNLLAAMTLCGLWHGANWTFVVWGALNGVYLIIHRTFRWAVRDLTAFRAALDTVPGIALRIAMTFTAVTLAFVLFRSPTFATAQAVFHRLFVPSGGLGCPVPPVTFWTFVVIVFAAHVFASRPANWVRWQQLSPAFRGVAISVAVFATLTFAPANTWTFIYFQF